MKRVLNKAWALTNKAEQESDHRGAMVGLREVRGCLESLNALLVRAGSGPNGAKLEVRGTYIAGKSTAFRLIGHPIPQH